MRNRENALTYEEDTKKCLTAGMNAHLAEPFQMEKAIAAIAEHCRNNNFGQIFQRIGI